ncbi:hypothetical protein IW140_004382 [Coemansia sp. RSA 1813]|nr:hypothetical protein EV178_004452 [Coemansia sp. RSA 1646]KAJ1768360.1 hypothetical protein LPJ74_004888 [Coemansia sp. RSA 1843]KAJ2087895.1 hypothetical protein IW138_004593 [Coemansia sp. RSA 986]KAJ2212909.1 hypothetical protein EV179_004310 [Coemansia sp. RSA 487]KAJ2567679.1 hypothetical protein IW140_004382 [Coemansia sp. RSA 1813]
MDPMQTEYIGASTSLGAILGLLIIITFGGTKCSRKTLLLTDSIVYVLGFVLVGVATDYTVCIAGRTILGIAHGVSTMIVPVYIGEISPKEYRGLFIAFNTAALNLGLPLGFGLAMALEPHVVDIGRWVFISNGAISLVLVSLVALFVPNSPRDLVYHGRLEKAQEVIKKLNYPDIISQDEMVEEINALIKAFDENRESRFMDMFSAGNLKALGIACVLQIAKQSSGFSALQYFSGYLFRLSGLLPESGVKQLPNLLLGLVQFIMAVGSLLTIDHLGRRRLLLISTIAMALGLIVLGGSFVALTGFEQINKSRCEGYSRCGSCVLDTKCGWANVAGQCMSRKLDNMADASVALSGTCHLQSTRDHVGSWMAVVSLIFSLGSFALGLGSIPWVIQAEMFSQALRSNAGSVAAIANWMFSYIWTVSFLQLAFVITLPAIFWLYAVLLVTILASVYWMIPETKGRALEEIAADISSTSD